MDKKKLAVLAALEAAPDGLLKADFREATSREVSSHTVQEEQLDPLLSGGFIVATEEESSDRRMKGMVARFRVTEAGKAALASCRAGVV